MWRILVLVLAGAVVMHPVLAEDAPAQPPNGADAQIAARISELVSDKAPLPNNMSTLYDLVRSIDGEAADWRKQAEQLVRSKANAPDIEGVRKHIITLYGRIGTLDCKTATPEAVTALVAELRDVYRTVSQIALEYNYKVPKLGDQPEAAQHTAFTCESLKAVVGDPKRQDLSVDIYNGMIAQREAANKRVDQSLAQIEKLSRLLQERKWAIQTAIAEKGAQQQLSGSLWKVISVIGLFSLGAIFVVRMFTVPLQMEWVATGQVIQFVTVMILLSVLMALGLAGILEQNILGTLLGGIAGHVLAQGVGRSAAHEAKRSKAAEPNDTAPGAIGGDAATDDARSA